MLTTQESLNQIKIKSELVTTRDRYYVTQQYLKILELFKQQQPECDQLRAKVENKIEQSLAKIEAKKAAIPPIEFPSSLPVVEKREEIARIIQEHQVVIIAGETGSGKTTQLPKICLSIGRGLRGLIGHTQPRRIAARSVSNRIAEELNSPLGDIVGYQVRFNEQVSDKTAIKLMTDGILLAEIQHDRFLSRYDTIIIDEAHERSLNIDFLLGYLKQLLPKRPDLKIIITSATIDVNKFSKHFNEAPIIEVSGRTFPVEVLYRPPLETESDSLLDAIISAVHEIIDLDNQGDILLFLSGERDIRETALRLRRESIPHLSVVPLYARLSIAEQNKIFQPHRGRRIVLATNVAETSLTVPGIRYVIDPGLARISRYSFRTKVQRLPIESISQASANQRKGRCGRISDGVCIRLYSEEDFLNRPEFTDPEILRTNLAAVILQMAQLRLGDVKRFPFVDMPDHRLINDGHNLLQELQATNSKQRLTAVGSKLGQLPVDPRFGRMLIAADKAKCLQEMLIIIAALSIQDPRERPADKQQAADQRHREFWHEDSDFLAYVNLWNVCEEQRQELTNNLFKKWCQKHFLSHNRLREWRDLHKQLLLACKKIDLTIKNDSASYDAVHRSLLTGLLGNIGQFAKEKVDDKNQGDYLGARNRRFSIFPGSSQFKKKPRWFVAGELLETSKLYAHTIAKINTDWVLPLAQHLVKRNYLEPHYDAVKGAVIAFEKISLYGLILVEKNPVHYGKLDPVLCRELFIRSALVEGRYAENKRIKNNLKFSSPEKHFYLHQQSIIKELQSIEAKSRRRDIVVDDEDIFRFYDERLPADICNLDGFEAWRKNAEQKQADLLFIERDRLMQRNDSHVSLNQFPDNIDFNGVRVPVKYHFDPLHSDDGATISVPMSVLHLIPNAQLEWLVPGFLAEKVTAMIKSLPKQWRKQFAPVPSTVEVIYPHLIADKNNNQKPLAECVSQLLYRHKGVEVPDECWQAISLDAYYLMNVHVVDELGKVVDRSRDLTLLKERYRDNVQDQIQVAGNNFEQTNLTEWSFGELPDTHVLKQGDLSIRTYPGLQDSKESVSLLLFDNPKQAIVNSLKGQVRLAILSQPQTIKYLRKNLLKNKDIALSLVNMGSREAVIDDIICSAVRQSLFDSASNEDTLLRKQAEFKELVNERKSEWVALAEQIAELLLAALQQVNEIKKQAKQFKNQLVLSYAVADINQQLQDLFYPQCLFYTPLVWLQQYSRFLKAVSLRLEKVPMNMNQDRAFILEIESLWNPYRDKLAMDTDGVLNFDQDLLHYRWMLEELRVSLFAQSLRTSIPVSVKRLKKQWEICKEK